MDADELNKLVEQIRKDYILIAKGKLWTIIGGFIGVLTAAGLITYGSAKAVLESSTAKRVEAEIQELKAKADKHVIEIKDMRDTHKDELERLSSYLGRTDKLEKEIPRINDELANGVKLGYRYHIKPVDAKGKVREFDLHVEDNRYVNGTRINLSEDTHQTWQLLK